MRRLRNLLLFGIGALALILGLAWTFRAQLAPFLGVNVDGGAGGVVDLVLPDGYAGDVFADGLEDPRFMAVSPEGVLFIAERGVDRVVALPDADGDGVADEVVEVGSGYGQAHDLAFRPDGTLLVAGETVLHEVALDALHEVDRRSIASGLPAGGFHTSKSVAVLPDGSALLSVGSSCNVCSEDDDRRAAIHRVTGGAWSRS